MRTVANQTLDGTAIIQTKVRTSDGGGGGTTTWTPAGTVSCHLAPFARRFGTEMEIGERIAADADWIVTLPANTTVTTKNRVTIAGTNYNVEAAHAPRTWELTRRLEVKEIV